MGADHESLTCRGAGEAPRGLRVMIREGSTARNLDDLLPLVARTAPSACAFVSDDREPDFLLTRATSTRGARWPWPTASRPRSPSCSATLNPAQCHRLADAGAIAPGFRADLALLDDLESFRVDRVWKHGVPVVEGGVAAAVPHIEVPVWVRQTVRAAPVGPTTLALPSSGHAVRVIEIVPGQLITQGARRDPDRARAAWWWPTRSATWPRSPSWSAITPRAGSASGS